MKKISILPTLCASAAVTVSPSLAQTNNPDQPNIVIILADDLGTNELSCYGGSNIQTPNIDLLAQEGIRLTNNYASCAMSVPIRASLYTGLYPTKHGSYQNHKKSYNNLKSVTHYLTDLGYSVGRTGKNHPTNQPNVYGFENITGFTVDCVASKPAPVSTAGIKEFINRNNNDTPFCLYVCSIHPHMPWDAGNAQEFNPDNIVLPPNCVDNARTRTDYCRYLAEIRELDNEVGLVIQSLKESGKLDNTLVIFLAEQGPQMPFGKWTCYNYGQNSAFIARFPQKIEKGTQSDAIVQYEDVLPTMIEFAGGTPPLELDGESCLGVLYGERTEHRDWAFGLHNNIPEGPAYPIRSIQDKRYKLIINLTPNASYHEKHMMAAGDNMWNAWLRTAETNPEAKLLTNRFMIRPAIELYDLQADPWELTNIAQLPEHTERIAAMQLALEQWMNQQGDRGTLMDTNNPEDPTLKTPLAISSVEDIDQYMRNDLSGNFFLSADITLPPNYEWIPIGASSPTDADPQRFAGIFDGRGHSITGLKIANATPFKGLFGRLDFAIVKNLDLKEVDIKGKAPIGGITGAMISASRIEGVSVSGTLQGDTEVGGIVGRVARDAIHTDYNKIHNCFVAANIRATSKSTNMNTPSCAGGIVASIHSNMPATNTLAKLDIQNVYFTGSVSSDQMSNIAGNAAGILAFTDNNRSVRMNQVLVLADQITAATPNYFYCRRLPAAPNNVIEYMNKLFVRNDISLSYFTDGGVGVQIPAGTIQMLPPDNFKTAQFYEENLDWDFQQVWDITDGTYPTLKRDGIGTSVAHNKLPYTLFSNHIGITVRHEGTFSVAIYDLLGKPLTSVIAAQNQLVVALGRGTYIVRIRCGTLTTANKVIV